MLGYSKCFKQQPFVGGPKNPGFLRFHRPLGAGPTSEIPYEDSAVVRAPPMTGEKRFTRGSSDYTLDNMDPGIPLHPG